MHKATIIPGSIQNLGTNGISFSAQCCNDPKTSVNKTIQHAHTLTTEELETAKNQFLRRIEDHHKAATVNAQHLEKLAAGQSDVTECDGCR